MMGAAFACQSGFSEAIEAVPAQLMEALDRSGATWLQKMRFGA